MTGAEKIVDKVQRLLALAQSDNVHEAAAASAMAQRLMTRHQISEAMLEIDAGEADGEISETILHETSGKVLAHWLGWLAVVVAEVNGCSVLRSNIRGRVQIQIIGRADDAAVASAVYTHLRGEIDRLAKRAARRAGSPGRTWVNNFRRGAMSVIGPRLKQAALDARAEVRTEALQSGVAGSALARIDQALAKVEDRASDAQAWRDGAHDVRRKSAPSAVRHDAHAWAAGERAGANVDLSPSEREKQRERLR